MGVGGMKGFRTSSGVNLFFRLYVYVSLCIDRRRGGTLRGLCMCGTLKGEEYVSTCPTEGDRDPRGLSVLGKADQGTGLIDPWGGCVCVGTCVYVCVGTCVGTCVYIRVCGDVCVHACVWGRVCTRTRVWVCVGTCAHVCEDVCVYEPSEEGRGREGGKEMLVKREVSGSEGENEGGREEL